MGTATDRPDPAPRTLGDLLYASPDEPRIAEQEWVDILRAIGAGDKTALRAIYDRSHPLVFTLIMCLTHDRATVEELTIDVYREVWRHASKHDPATATVLEWIMSEARLRAIEHVSSFQQRKCMHVSPHSKPRRALTAGWESR